MDDSFKEFQEHKRDLISNHNDTARRVRKLRTSPLNNSVVTHTRSGAFEEKAQKPAPSVNQLLRIYCPSLAPKTVHWGRVLRGTFIVDPYVINAAFTLIEDEVGAVVQVSFYNFSSPNLSYSDRQRAASSLFGCGKKVTIIEPYCKLDDDGSLRVRVDNLSKDVKIYNDFEPCSSEAWCNEGNALFKKQLFTEAIHCFRCSIDTHSEHKLAAVLLSNIASALLSKEELKPSLLFAVASFIVDSSFFRPYYTAGFILNKLNNTELAFKCLEQCRQLKAPPKYCRQLEEGLGNGERNCVSAFKWNSDTLDIIVSENVPQLLRISPDAVDSSADTTTSTGSLSLKGRGNKLFDEKKFDESIRQYCMALRSISKVADLLKNRAVCYTRLEKYSEAVLHASAAILITPNLAKAHYQKSLSLLQLNCKQEALECCETALKVVSKKGDLKDLHKRIVDSLEEPSVQTQWNPGFKQKRTQRDQAEMLVKNDAPSSKLALVNKMIEAVSSRGESSCMTQDYGKLDERVPEFHMEFSHENEWPAGCDTHSSMELLARSYEHARAPDTLLQIDLKNPTPHHMTDLCIRLNSRSKDVLQWWLQAQLSSLSPRTRRPFASSIHQSFTNSPCSEERKILGTVHVSVGFVDLSELLRSNFVSSAEHDGPLRWIGYEASAYSVAKTMVIAQMIRRQMDIDDILQVWYSSSWRKRTLRSFRCALKEVLDSTKGPDTTQCTEQVAVLLHHWQQFDVSLQNARREWLSRHECRNHTVIANFRRKIDRVAMCRYLVSGDVLDGKVGSIVMFGLPKNTSAQKYEVSMDEWFLHCLSIASILQEVDSETNVIDAAIRILRRGIWELKERVRTGTVNIEVRHKLVSPYDRRTQYEIRRLSPYSISWSNLCDYYANEAFHKMARECSGPSTVHYLYSINWSTEVKGAHLIDYADAQKELLNVAKEGISIFYKLTGASAYLQDPPITHPYNLAASSLGHTLHDVWTKKFFMDANLENKECQVGQIDLNAFDVLARGPCTMNMIYTFDSTAKLNSSAV